MKRITKKYLESKGFKPNGHDGFVVEFSEYGNWAIYEPKTKIFAIAGEMACTTEHGFQVKITNILSLEKWLMFLEGEGFKIKKS